MTAPARTSWRIVGLGFPNPELRQLEVALTVDTDAPVILRAIEGAAARAGVLLERVEPEAEAPA